ncbi:hypothetical protein FBU30_008804 [Linnemannia zychae]|nr:hypothetical protein FBU30_008804 [Linnemannia zychae]
MIVDHLVTRSAVRSLGLVCAAVVPLAASFLLYTFTYKETPLDTLVHHIPLVFQLLQSNDTHITISASTLAAATKGDASYFYSNPTAFAAASPAVFVSPFDSILKPDLIASATTSMFNGLSPSKDDPFAHSLSLRMTLSIASFLERLGLRDPTQLPGYHHLVAFKPYLAPIITFIATHQTLAWIVSLLNLWMIAEVLFYIHFWKRLARAQEIDRIVKGPKTAEERRELFERCMETVGTGADARKWVETWFDTGRTDQPAKSEEIARSNMMQWLAWAFWASSLEEVFGSPSDMMELNRMVDYIEATKGIKFAIGFNPNVQCIRLAFDPVIASHRPLIYYALVWSANTFAGFVFMLLGFSRYEGTVNVNSSKKNNSRIRVNPATDLSYWYRAPVSPDNKVPLVFLHGIGVGLVQYIHWVIALSTISRPIIMIEVPYVSNKFIKGDCMTPDETYYAVERILRRHDYPKATFFGHSLGTMLCAAVCRASPASSSKSIVAGLILADPICFLTHHSIARNFAYRIPSTAAELIMDLFAAREIGTSWYIMRRFHWNQCIFFPKAWKKRNERSLPYEGRLSPVLPKKTRIFLSRKDNLLNMDMIADYIRNQVGLREEKEELNIMEGMDHAQFLLRPDWFMKVLKAAETC